MQEVSIGDRGKIEYDKIGMLKLTYPLVVSNNEISTIFAYDLFEGKFVDASLADCSNKKLIFELEPNDHVLFNMTCDSKTCTLKLLEVKVKRELKYHNGYDYEETTDVSVNELYNADFDRHRFRSYSNDSDTPNILAFILAYLIPLDLPYVYYHYADTNEIIEELKRFFES